MWLIFVEPALTTPQPQAGRDFQLFILAAESFLQEKPYVEPSINQTVQGVSPLA